MADVDTIENTIPPAEGATEPNSRLPFLRSCQNWRLGRVPLKPIKRHSRVLDLYMLKPTTDPVDLNRRFKTAATKSMLKYDLVAAYKRLPRNNDSMYSVKCISPGGTFRRLFVAYNIYDMDEEHLLYCFDDGFGGDDRLAWWNYVAGDISEVLVNAVGGGELYYSLPRLPSDRDNRETWMWGRMARWHAGHEKMQLEADRRNAIKDGVKGVD